MAKSFRAEAAFGDRIHLARRELLLLQHFDADRAFLVELDQGAVDLVVVARPVKGEAVREELLEVVAGEGFPAEEAEQGVSDGHERILCYK